MTGSSLLVGCTTDAAPWVANDGPVASDTSGGSASDDPSPDDSGANDTSADPVPDDTAGGDSATDLPAPDPLAGLVLYVDPQSRAAQQAASWRSSRPGDADLMDRIAEQSVAKWLGNWNSDVEGDVRTQQAAAASQNSTASYVVYNIPQRDCGGYSSGGTSDSASYLAWVDSIVRGLGQQPSIVILEPDALTLTSCLSSSQLADRMDMLRTATQRLRATGARVYLDVGHSAWLSASDAAAGLTAAGVGDADGFAVNVSNFRADDETLAYATQVSDAVGGARFVIDTSRNGLGPNGSEWCNPAGRALGLPPDTDPAEPGLDARLWVKTPGESDGSCNGGPSAGSWWPDYALGLAQRATWPAAS